MLPARRSTFWVPLALLMIGGVLSWWMQSSQREAPVPPAAGAPRRVVLFAPNLNEMAAVLGHADRLVAITDFCTWPDSILHLPRIGGQLDPDLEALALLRPDLLVIQGESPLLRSFASAQGLVVADLKMDDTIESILAGAVRLDRLLGGDGTRGHAVADSLRAELDSISGGSAAEEQPVVLLVLSRDPDGLGNLLTAGAGTFFDELITVAGGRSWAGPRTRGYATVALEALAEDPPDVVVEFSAGGATTDLDRLRVPWIELLEPDPAVELLEFEGIMVPGPRIVDTARHLRAAIERASR